MTSGPGRVGRVSRQCCGQTGMWHWSPCDRLSEPPQSHQPALAPCHPTWLQTEGKLWILNLAPGLHCFLPRCCTVHPLWLLNSVGFFICEMHWCGGWLSNSVALSIRYSNWMFAEGVILSEYFCLLENVYLQGRHSEADKSYKRRRCKPVKRHYCRFITRHISTASGPLTWWQCILECVRACVCVYPKPLPAPHSVCSCLTGDIWSSSGDICAICIHGRVSACYMTCKTER